jgi:NAD(P)-dependent dehydrogenase (short-subunit alcohol dehydrogenase family)
VATNLLGPTRLVAALIEHLATRPQATIMTVSSGLAFVPLPITPTYNATKSAIHSFTESLRIQLADTSVEVLELVPPAVRTALVGQEEADNAMPLDAFIDEVMDLLGSTEQPNSSRRSNPCDSPRPADSTPRCCTCCPAIDGRPTTDALNSACARISQADHQARWPRCLRQKRAFES